jgi:ubiquinone/menaquinone biosynthesis C-methylase UbiE
MRSKSVISPSGVLANDWTHSRNTAIVDTEELARGYTFANPIQHDTGIFRLKRLEITRSMRVLDVGCGLGNLRIQTVKFVGETGSLVGIELRKEHIAIAIDERAKPNILFYERILGIELTEC